MSPRLFRLSSSFSCLPLIPWLGHLDGYRSGGPPLVGEREDSGRAIARLTGSDRNTVRRIVRLAEEVGIRAGTPWPDERKLQGVRQRMGRPDAVVVTREAEERSDNYGRTAAWASRHPAAPTDRVRSIPGDPIVPNKRVGNLTFAVEPMRPIASTHATG
jgi:hypothetical protein